MDLARPIAVIGLSCRYPGAKDARSLWENILARRVQFRPIPDARLPLSDYYDPDPSAEDLTYGRCAAVLDGWSFDPAANRVPKATFESTDAAHWLALDVARDAVRHAGLQLGSVDRDRVGVVIGNTLTGEETRANSLRLRWPFVRRALKHAAESVGMQPSEHRRLEGSLQETWRSVFPRFTEDSLAGGLSNTIAGRICNALDLHGGGYVVDGACASSLLAVATASEMLSSGQLDVVIAGGVDISLDPFELVGFAKATALSRGDMNVYDRNGKGFIPGEGCGFVVLQRMSDARDQGRRVFAAIRGWGISSDGRGGITAPSVGGQALALRRAYERAGYSPHTLSFVEGHGTGTAVGDRVELEGIAAALGAWGEPEERSVGVTSLKSVVGHTKAAAGIGGLIKATIALNQRVVPPTAGCYAPHPVFSDRARALYPALDAEQHPAEETLRAGVSAMGFGGINTHVTLEGADPPAAEWSVDPSAAAAPMTCEIFPLAASDPESLRAALVALEEQAEGLSNAELGDLAASRASDVSGGPARAALLASSADELVAGIETLLARLDCGDPSGPALAVGVLRPLRVGLLFPGQGSQAVGMASVLCERWPWARESLARAEEAVGGMSEALSAPRRDPSGEALARAADVLRETRIAQPAIALASALWLELLDRMGLVPEVVCGHSLGELSALHASGAFDLQELVTIAALRGEIMAADPERPGAMAALSCPAAAARALCGEGASVASLNAPDQTVISGDREQVERAVERARERGIEGRMLRVSNAFHSPLVASAARAFAAEPRLPARSAGSRAVALSCVDGAPIPEGVDLRAHLAAQIEAPVDFLALVAALRSRCELLVEVGPGRTLSDLALRCGADRALPLEPDPLDRAGRDRVMLQALAALHLGGHDLRWPVLYEGRLARPFLPARERSFYRNPCERPFSSEARAAPASRPARVSAEPEGPMEILQGLVAERTAFAREGLAGSLRLLDDLNLDSIKAASLLADLSGRLGLPAGALAGLANGSLEEIVARAAERAREGAHSEPERLPEAGVVADFVMGWREAPIPAGGPPKGLVVLGQGSLAARLSALSQGEPEEVVLFMPEGPDDLEADVALLCQLAGALSPPQGPPLSRVTLVGRGDGRFGQAEAEGARIGIRSFAASLAMERPDLRVRAVDLAAGLGEERALAALLAEMALAGSGAAGIDAGGVRRTPALCRVDEASSTGEAPLPTGGRALVTGGGRGITAACAKRLAEITGCSLLLTGRSAIDAEIEGTLAAMAGAGIEASYHVCDVTEEASLRSLLEREGPVDIVLHGAGLNRPAPALSVRASLALAEISPKVRGIETLARLLDDRPPALFIALTSVIGALGMEGNAWYALSNERADLELRKFARAHPGCRTLSLAYSVWDEVGMGVKLGSVRALSSRGIGAIPVVDGVARFARWLSLSPPDPQIIVAARLGGAIEPYRGQGRFAGQILAQRPGVEHVARVRLHPQTDPFLLDHDYNGSLLFPTVMGLEAMAQAACCALQLGSLPAHRFEAISLERPIVVHPERGEEIELVALALERRERGEALTVQVSIRTASTGFEIDHFSARIVLEAAAPGTLAPPEVSEPLDIVAEDLYGVLLFQGPLFQRIRRVLALDEREVVFQTEIRGGTRARPEGFSEAVRAPLVSADPYWRDTLLQAAQLVVSPDLALPVGIERIEALGEAAEGPAIASARLTGREGDMLRAEVTAWDARGRLVERLVGYTLRILRRDTSLPDVSAMLSPEEHDRAALSERIAPGVEVAHKRALPERVAPVARDGATTIAVPGALGCALRRVARRGVPLAALAEVAREAAREALGEGASLTLSSESPDRALFRAQVRDRRLDVLALVAPLARGGLRILAVALPVAAEGPGGDLLDGYGDLGAEGASIDTSGPDGQARFRQRSAVLFKEASEPSGSLRYTHYFRRMGELRELAARPVLSRWVSDFRSGRFGAVTNRTELVVLGRASAGERIEGSVWSAGSTGPLRSTMELRFSWEALGEDGTRRPLSYGAMATTWVEIVGHGEAVVAENPPYLEAFAKKIAPPPHARPAPLPSLDTHDRGALIRRFAPHPGEAPLARASFLSGREHSNIVGNVYFAGYPGWQAEAIDSMFVRLYPPYARGQGELQVGRVRVEHFREAMPGDEIVVHLHPVCLWERALALRSEIFRCEAGKLVKLAAGEVEGVWLARGEDGRWAPAYLPVSLLERLSLDESRPAPLLSL